MAWPPPTRSSNRLTPSPTSRTRRSSRAPRSPNGKSDKLTVWTGTQRPFGVRGELAEAFRIPEDKVRVIVPDTGSGYGGKHTGECAIEAARLARAAGKPVKLVWTREEEFTWAYFRPAGVIDIKSGVKTDGTITAWEFHNYNSGDSGIQIKYDIPNNDIQFHPSNSPLRQGFVSRAGGDGESLCARDAHRRTGANMDPLAFRLKNIKDERMRGVLEAAAKAFGWGQTKPAPGTALAFRAALRRTATSPPAPKSPIDQRSKRKRRKQKGNERQRRRGR